MPCTRALNALGTRIAHGGQIKDLQDDHPCKGRALLATTVSWPLQAGLERSAAWMIGWRSGLETCRYERESLSVVVSWVQSEAALMLYREAGCRVPYVAEGFSEDANQPVAVHCPIALMQPPVQCAMYPPGILQDKSL